MQKRATRVLRGLGSGAAATLVAAASHSVAGGRMPSLVGVGLALFFAVIVSIVLAGGGRSVGRLVTSVVLSQLGFHLLFSTIGGAGEVAHGAHHSVTIVASAATMSHANPAMWLGHGLAAVVTVLVLRYAGTAWGGLRRTAGILVARLTASAPALKVVARGHLAIAATVVVPRRIRESIEAIGTRGPPVALRSI